MDAKFELQINFIGKKLRSTIQHRDADVVFDKSSFEDLGQLGLFSLSIREAIRAFRILGSSSQDIPFGVSCVAQFIAVELLRQFGNNEQRSKYLEALARGQKIAAVCNSEPGAGTDVRAIKSSGSVNGNLIDLKIEKRGATNLSKADVLFCSVWKHVADQKPSLEVMLVNGKSANQISYNSELAGFHTGLTGSASITNLQVPISEVQLGRDRAGYSILRYCFNLERLLIASLVAGALESASQEVNNHVLKQQSFGKPLGDHQYVQEKVISLYAATQRLAALIDSACGERTEISADSLAKVTKSLALLKLATVEEGHIGFMSLLEIFGFIGYTHSNSAQKLIRDHMALRMLGGTKEQQKILLFNEIIEETKTTNQIHNDIKKMIAEKMETKDETESTQVS